MPGIIAGLEASGLQRREYVLFLADPDANGLLPGYDAVQTGFRGRFDVSECLEEFFPPVDVPARPPYKPPPFVPTQGDQQTIVRGHGRL
jgi:hypothetical protein